MKLTSTNRSNDLIVPITNAHLQAAKLLEHYFMSSRLNAAAPLTRGQRGPLPAGSPPCPTRSRACGAAHRNLFPRQTVHGKGIRSRRLRKADRPSPLMRRARAGQIIEDDRYGRERINTKPGIRQKPASQICSLPTWWLWRGACTRSHPEHGRETTPAPMVLRLKTRESRAPPGPQKANLSSQKQ